MNSSDGCIRFHRAEFLDIFVNNLSKNVTSFGKRLLSYSSQDREIKLLFHDGSETSCDVLIGCDGVKSVVRRQLLESLSDEDGKNLRDFIEPMFTGTIAYRGLIPAERLPKYKDGRVHSAVDRPMMVRGVFYLAA